VPKGRQPADPQTEQGPQVRRADGKNLGYRQAGEGRERRCSLVANAWVKRFLVAPTIFDNVRDEMGTPSMIFGPVVSVLPLRNSPKLPIAPIARRTAGRRRVDQRHRPRPIPLPEPVKAGTVWVSVITSWIRRRRSAVQNSGQGPKNGEAALEHYTETKTVTVKLG